MRRVLILVGLLALGIAADNVYFKDGRPPFLKVETWQEGGKLFVKYGIATMEFPMSEIDRVEVSADGPGPDVSSNDGPDTGTIPWIQLTDGRTFTGRILDLGQRVRVRADAADFWVEKAKVARIWDGTREEVEEPETTYGSGEQVAINFDKKFSIIAPTGWVIDRRPARPMVDAIVSDEDRRVIIEIAVIPGDLALYVNPNDVSGEEVEDRINARLEKELDRVQQKAKVKVEALPGLAVPAYRATYRGRYRFNDTDYNFQEYRFASSGNIYSIRAYTEKDDDEQWQEEILEAVANFSTLGPISLAGTVYTDAQLGLSIDALDPEWFLTVGLCNSGSMFRVLFDEGNRFFELRDLSLGPDASLEEAMMLIWSEFSTEARRPEKLGEEPFTVGESEGLLFRYSGIVSRRSNMQYTTLVFRAEDGRMLAATGNYRPPRANKDADEISVDSLVSSIRFLAGGAAAEELQRGEEALGLLFAAEIAVDLGRWEEAIEKADQALAIFPRFARALRMKAKALDGQGEASSRDVQALYQQASELEPDPNLDAILAELWQKEGNEKIEDGRWRSGLKLLEKAYNTNPDERSLQKDLLKAYEGYAESLEEEDDLKEAINYVERAYRRFKELPDLRELLDGLYKKQTKAYEKEKRYDRAIGVIKDRLKLWEGDDKKIKRIERELAALEKKRDKEKEKDN